MLIKQPKYVFSEDITIREWGGGTGKLWVNVGYVKDHPEHNQIVLQKQYINQHGPKTDTFYIRGEADWLAIRAAVERLWPELQQQVTSADIDQAIQKVSHEVQLLDFVARFPDLLNRLPDDMDILSLPNAQKDALRKLLEAGGSVARRLIKRLAQEPVTDLEGLVKILEELRLSTVNSLVNQVTSRLSFISAFEKAIHDDASYERRGPHSIHNLLRANIWILDRNYTILLDDETLKNIIYAEFAQDLDPFDPPAARPDFLCMTGRRQPDAPIGQLVIIEIKRPSVTLTMEHMAQLMGYREILERNSGRNVQNFKCYLIGRQRHHLFRSNDLSPAGFIVKTYTDFIGEARQFYEEYLEIVQRDELAI